MADNTEMPFLSHLAELRTRLFRAALGVALCAAIALYFSDSLFLLLTAPLRHDFPGAQLIGTGPAEGFVTRLKVGLVGGFIAALPYSFYQLWLFIAPGLHEHEKRLAVPFVFFSTVFFLAGAFFCYEVVVPFAFLFFADEFTVLGITPQIRTAEYFSFVIQMVIVFGVMFELPVLSFILARLRILSSKWLLKQFRYAIVGIFIVAGILTPPDVVTQLLLAAPLTVLYLLCIAITRFVEKRAPVAAQTQS